MELNRGEWSQAQDLLLKLVQILSPLAERDEPVSVILNKRFFYVPPALGEDAPLARSVRLLSTLHSVQKQVEEFIGEDAPQTQEAAAVSKPEKKKPPEQKPAPVLAKQAQKLIDQVQDAIGKLCHSANIKDPKEEPLRSALRRLKPNLDQIIEGVAYEGMHSEREGLPPYRFALPRSPREELIRKLLLFPENEISSKTRPAELTRPVEIKKGGEADPISDQVIQKGKKGAASNPTPSAEKKQNPVQQESERVDVKPLARNALPATPVVPLTRQLTPASKKKKRKGFWFRDDEEDRNNP